MSLVTWQKKTNTAKRDNSIKHIKPGAKTSIPWKETGKETYSESRMQKCYFHAVLELDCGFNGFQHTAT